MTDGPRAQTEVTPARTAKLTRAAPFRPKTGVARAVRLRLRTDNCPAVALVIAHPRIEHGVEEVDDEVEDDYEYRDENHGAHHQRVVAVDGTENEVTADARDSEDCLDHHRAG